MALFEKEIKQNSNLFTSKQPSEKLSSIVHRIINQSYDYSARNSSKKGGLVTSLFYEIYKECFYYYIPIFNYFEREVTWIKVKANENIQLSQKYSYYKYDEFSEKEIQIKLDSGSIKNLIISKSNIKKINLDEIEDQAIYILNEVLYNKRIYIIFCFTVYDHKEWLMVPIESSLSGRGKNFLRTDEHGNNFSSTPFEETNRYQIYQFKLDNI